MRGKRRTIAGSQHRVSKQAYVLAGKYVGSAQLLRLGRPSNTMNAHRFAALLRRLRTDGSLLCIAVCVLAVIRVSLVCLPFQTVRRWTCIAAHVWVRPQRIEHQRIERVVAAITTASRYVPRASCLTQALATQLLLARSGIGTELHIGVARSPHGHLEGHAWLEHNHRVIIGGSGVERFARLTIKDVHP